MASTRNKNSPGNYELEQRGMALQKDYALFENGSGAKAHTMNFPGHGLLTGRYAPSSLSQNACDIESFLYGIGSSNLVKPKEPVTGQIYEIASLNIAPRPPRIIDAPFQHESDQRPSME